MVSHRPECRFPPLGWCRQRFPGRSFSTTTSSIVSATSRLSFALAIGLEPMAPQWLDFLKRFQPPGIRHVHAAIFGLQLVKLAGLMPCLRQTSATVSPASCPLIIPMIGVSVKRLFLMSSAPSGWADTTSD